MSSPTSVAAAVLPDDTPTYRPLRHAATVPGQPHVHLLVDPPDSLTVQRAIEGLADLDHGFAVVTPTLGVQGVGTLLRDIIAAVGLPRVPGCDRLTRGLVKVTISILRRQGVHHLYVLRAHCLPPAAWAHLLEIAALAPIDLWLVIHQELPTRAQLRAIQGHPVQWHRPPRRPPAGPRIQPWLVRRARLSAILVAASMP